MTQETLEALATNLNNLERERDELVAWLRSEGPYEPTDKVDFLQPEKHAKMNRLHFLTAEIERDRQRYIARLLDSTHESSEALKKSSLRLERYSGALLILTAVLAVAGAGAYFLQAETSLGIPGREALGWATFGVFCVLALILVSFLYLGKRYRDLGA